MVRWESIVRNTPALAAATAALAAATAALAALAAQLPRWPRNSRVGPNFCKYENVRLGYGFAHGRLYLQHNNLRTVALHIMQFMGCITIQPHIPFLFISLSPILWEWRLSLRQPKCPT